MPSASGQERSSWGTESRVGRRSGGPWCAKLARSGAGAQRGCPLRAGILTRYVVAPTRSARRAFVHSSIAAVRFLSIRAYLHSARLTRARGRRQLRSTGRGRIAHGLPADCLRLAYGPPAACLRTACGLPTDRLRLAYGPPADRLRTAYRPPTGWPSTWLAHGQRRDRSSVGCRVLQFRWQSVGSPLQSCRVRADVLPQLPGLSVQGALQDGWSAVGRPMERRCQAAIMLRVTRLALS
jgi:hypothetical protein